MNIPNNGMNKTIISNTQGLLERFKQQQIPHFADMRVTDEGEVMAGASNVHSAQGAVVETLGVLTMGYAHLAELSLDTAKHPEHYNVIARAFTNVFPVDGSFLPQLESISLWLKEPNYLDEVTSKTIVRHWLENQTKGVLESLVALDSSALGFMGDYIRPLDLQSAAKEILHSMGQSPAKQGGIFAIHGEEIMVRVIELMEHTRRRCRPHRQLTDIEVIGVAIMLLPESDVSSLTDRQILADFLDMVRRWRDSDDVVLAADNAIDRLMAAREGPDLPVMAGLKIALLWLATELDDVNYDLVISSWMTYESTGVLRELVVTESLLSKELRSILGYLPDVDASILMDEVISTARSIVELRGDDEGSIVGLHESEVSTQRVLSRGREIPSRHNDHSYSHRTDVSLDRMDQTPPAEEITAAIRGILDAADNSPIAARECHEAIATLIARAYNTRGRGRY